MNASGLRIERDGDIAILWIDQPQRSVAVLDDAFLRAIPAVLDQLDADESVKGAVLVNAKPGTFLAGADISSFLTYQSPEEVVAAIEEGNALLERIERWRKPLVVAVGYSARHSLSPKCVATTARTCRSSIPPRPLNGSAPDTRLLG